MALQAKEIKSRLRSIKNTKKITHTMELVSAAKMRRAIDAAVQTRPYASMMFSIVQAIRKNLNVREKHYQDIRHFFEEPGYSLTEKKKKKVRVEAGSGFSPEPQGDSSMKTVIVMFTSNRGLCGSFNSHLVREVYGYIKAHPKEKIEVIGIGKKGVSLLSIFGIQPTEAYEKDDSGKNFASLAPMASKLFTKFQKKEIDKVMLAYTDFKSSFLQLATMKKLLPFTEHVEINIDPEEIVRDALKADFHPEKPYLYEPTALEILTYILPRIVEVELFQALLESNASEHSSRMMAMKNATDAATDIVSDLTLLFNRARQAAITKEIAEISAGSAAIV